MSGSVSIKVTCANDGKEHTMELLDPEQFPFISAMTVLCGYVKCDDGEYLGDAHRDTTDNAVWTFIRRRHVVSNDNAGDSGNTAVVSADKTETTP
jgi:hypothetical protein